MQRVTRSATLDGTSTVPDLQVPERQSDTTLAGSTSRRRIVFPDPVAFRFLEGESCVSVVESRTLLRGYELYLVEQWACSRQSPTLVVVTYTGDERHCIVAGILAIPEDENLWSPKLRMYFRATRQFHARPKETGQGELMVTNLSSFPSALTVIPVPDGDIRKHRQAFIVNEDLKRLGCSGRSGLSVEDPTEATQAKFQQLYKTSDRVPFAQSVLELIKLCQVALYMFEKLDHEYIDGLLCDVTETAISNWWTEVGAEHYNFEPTDGILGPSTVAALLGMLMGARNRLHWYGAPVSKDVFDIESTKRGVAYFQKAFKLEKTRRLDRQTLFKLHTVTAKAAVGEGWGVQKAVKSTMTEFGGKRGEIVMGMVSGKDKGGLADIETLDIDTMVNLAYGERPKWLWHGKARRTATDYHEHEKLLYSKEDGASQAAKRIQTMPAEDELEQKRSRDEFSTVYSAAPQGSATSFHDSPGERDALHRTVLKSVAGKMNDARSGLGRIKDAVGGGRKTHTGRPSISAKEEFAEGSNGLSPQSSLAPLSAQVSGPPPIGRAFTWRNKPEEYLAAMRRGDSAGLGDTPDDSRVASTVAVGSKPSSNHLSDDAETQRNEDEPLSRVTTEARRGKSRATSVAQSTADDTDAEDLAAAETRRKNELQHIALTRRHSLDISDLSAKQGLEESRWARRLSFSDAEEAILIWEELVDITQPVKDLKMASAFAEISHHLSHGIDGIVYDIEPWVEEKLKTIAALDERYAQNKDELQNLYYQFSEACQRVRASSDELLAEERAHLTESVKEIEVLVARLEYEINALVQKVDDVEDGLRNFGRQVEDVEKRAEELKIQLETESWLHWFVRTLTGVGTGPNITRSK